MLELVGCQWLKAAEGIAFLYQLNRILGATEVRRRLLPRRRWIRLRHNWRHHRHRRRRHRPRLKRRNSQSYGTPMKNKKLLDFRLSLTYVADDELKREARKGLVEADDLATGDDFIVVIKEEAEVGEDMSLQLDSTTKRAGPEIAVVVAVDDFVIVVVDDGVLLVAVDECIDTLMTLCCCCILICCCSSAWTPLMELPGGMTIFMRFGMPPAEEDEADPSIPP